LTDYVGRHTILAVVVGSRAYGLAGAESDHDRRGVYAAPTAEFWRFDKPPTHLDGPNEEQFSWEIERFCTLAPQGNPTVLEVLWSPLVEHVTADGTALRDIRPAFLSRRVAQTYGGYARDQLNRVQARRDRTGETNHKQAMHMIRLLIAGAHVLRTGEVLVDVTPLRDRLLAVVPELIARKREAEHGPFPPALAAALDRDVPRLRAELEAARDASHLPTAPTSAAADALHDLIVSARLS
jgi:predicted nucleotidyltransferase